jgi:hypothetical protein
MKVRRILRISTIFATVLLGVQREISFYLLLYPVISLAVDRLYICPCPSRAIRQTAPSSMSYAKRRKSCVIAKKYSIQHTQKKVKMQCLRIDSKDSMNE